MRPFTRTKYEKVQYHNVVHGKILTTSNSALISCNCLSCACCCVLSSFFSLLTSFLLLVLSSRRDSFVLAICSFLIFESAYAWSTLEAWLKISRLSDSASDSSFFSFVFFFLKTTISLRRNSNMLQRNTKKVEV